MSDSRGVHVGRLTGALAALSLASCGGAPAPTVTAPAPVVASVPAPPPAPPAPPPDVPPPADLFVTATLGHPDRSFDVLSDLMQQTAAWRKAMAFADAFGLKELAASLDWKSPATVAAAGDNVAVSIAVATGEASRLAERLHMDPTPEGGFRTGLAGAKSSGKGDGNALPFACDVTAPGIAAQRLVCGTSPEALESLGPVLARMKADDHAPDLHVDMAAAKIRDAMIEGSARDNSDGTKASDLGKTIVKDFANDLDALTLDVSLGRAVEATLGMRFRSQTSPFTRAITGHPDRAAVPQGAFWHLPKDADLAFYSQGADPSDLEGVRTLLFTGLEDSMKDDVCPEGRAYILARLRALFFTGGPFVIGVGNDVAGASKAVTAFRALPKPKDTAAARSRTRQALENWTLIEVDEPSSKWVEPMRELALADKKFAKCRPTPAAGAADASKPKERTTTEVLPVPSGAHLPSGTLHVAARTVPADKNVPPHTMNVFVVPEGDHTWFAIGENEATVTAKIRAALGGASDGTLEGRAGLEFLHGSSAAGGFVSVEGISLASVDDDTSEQLRNADKPLGMLLALPSKGTIPIPVTWRATSKDVGTRFVLPRPALVELLGLLNP